MRFESHLISGRKRIQFNSFQLKRAVTVRRLPVSYENKGTLVRHRRSEGGRRKEEEGEYRCLRASSFTSCSYGNVAAEPLEQKHQPAVALWADSRYLCILHLPLPPDSLCDKCIHVSNNTTGAACIHTRRPGRIATIFLI